MNRSRRQILVMGAAALLGIPEGLAQPSPKRVIWLGPGKKGQERIRKAIAAQGLVEGRDLVLSFESFRDSSAASSEAQADELVKRRPDLIVMVGGIPLTVFLQRRTRQIPVVFYNLSWDPARLGLVESIRRPGANVTGTTVMQEQGGKKIWQLLKTVRPSMQRGGILHLEDEWGPTPSLEDLEGAIARLDREVIRDVETTLDIRIVKIEVSKDVTFAELAAAVKTSRAEALNVHHGLPRDALRPFLQTSTIPTCNYGGAENGLLLGLWFDFGEGEAHAVGMAARILRGESPATIPVYRTNRHSVSVNLRLARAVGIEIPASILAEADRIIE